MRHIRSKGLGGGVLTSQRLQGDRRELTVRMAHPLTRAAELYLRRVLSPIADDLVMGDYVLRLTCDGTAVDNVARILGSVLTQRTTAEIEREAVRAHPVPLDGGREPTPQGLGPLDLGPPRRAWREPMRRTQGGHEDPSAETVKAVRDYLSAHPGASYDAIVRDLGIGWATAIACVHRLGDLRGRERA